MFFYVVPICLLWIQIYKKLKADNGSVSIKKFLISYIKWFDFYIIPVAFFAIKQIWFRPDPNGLYSDYNVVTIGKCLNAIKLLPGMTKRWIYNIITRELTIIWQHKWILILLCIPFILLFVLHRCSKNRKDAITRMTSIQSLVGCIIGLILLMGGMYPYVVIRQSEIGIIGVSGRDSILTCIGAAVLIVCFMELIELAEWFKYALLICAVILATGHFTDCYAGYLRDYYGQQALERVWERTDDVKNGKTFIYVRQGNVQPVGECFYELDAISRKIYGDRTRYFACGVPELTYILDDEEKQKMKNETVSNYIDYDLNDIQIAGVMLANYSFSKLDAIKLRFEECFEKERYYERLEDGLDYEFIPITKEESDYIIHAYLDGKMTTNEELLNWMKITQ